MRLPRHRPTARVPASWELPAWVMPTVFVAALLGGLWYDTRRRERAVGKRLPPVGAFVEAEDAHLHYVDAGSGDPCTVLIHGALLSLQDFVASPSFDRLAAQGRVLAFDRPGYGYSERPGRMGSAWRQARLLRAALRELGVERPVLVGHSYGMAVVLAYAAQFPGEVRGLVCLGGGVAYPMPRLDLAPLMLPALPLVGGLLRTTLLQPVYRVLIPAMIRACFAPQAVPAHFADTLPLDFLLRPEQLRAVAEDFQALVPSLARLSRHYGEITLPVTVLAGEEDRIAYPKAHAQRLVRALPNATLELVPGIVHMIHHARPDLVVAAVASVMRAAGGPGGASSGKDPSRGPMLK